MMKPEFDEFSKESSKVFQRNLIKQAAKPNCPLSTIAAVTGLEPDVFDDIECCMNRLDLIDIHRIAVVLECDPRDLLCDDESSDPNYIKFKGSFDILGALVTRQYS